MKHSYCLFFLFLLFSSCAGEDDSPQTTPTDPNELSYEVGKNSYQTAINGTDRNFHVYVPASYETGTPSPLVFMFHGSGGNGNAVYDNSGWKEIADTAGFICVFPTANEYFVVKLQAMQTKWSAVGLEEELEPDALIQDDIPFVEDLLAKMQATFSIDESRIYASGFSNGGGFSKSRIMCERSNIFAAIATCGGHALPMVVPVQSPDLISLHTIMGNKDDKKLELAGQTLPFPMDGPSIMSHGYLRGNIDNILSMLQLDSSYTQMEAQPNFNTLIFDQSQSAFQHEYRFRMVNGLEHVWPNGTNHPSGLNAAEVFWDFFQEHVKE